MMKEKDGEKKLNSIILKLELRQESDCFSYYYNSKQLIYAEFCWKWIIEKICLINHFILWKVK